MPVRSATAAERLIGRRLVVDVAVLDRPEPVETVEHEHLVQIAALGAGAVANASRSAGSASAAARSASGSAAIGS